jgi:hypothetical protein
MTTGTIDFSGSESGGQAPASITVAGFSSVPGWPLDRPSKELQEMTSPAVNGRRWREVRSQYRPWRTTILIPATLYIDAMNYGRLLLKNHGAICSVSVPLAGTMYRWSAVHFELEQDPEARAGAIYASGVTGAAHVSCACTFTLTELSVLPS